MPDVNVIHDLCGQIDDAKGVVVSVHDIQGEIQVVLGMWFITLTRERALQLAELLRRLAAGEPLKD